MSIDIGLGTLHVVLVAILDKLLWLRYLEGVRAIPKNGGLHKNRRFRVEIAPNYHVMPFASPALPSESPANGQ